LIKRKRSADIVNTRRIRDPFERNRQFQELAAQRERDSNRIVWYSHRSGSPPSCCANCASTLPALLQASGGGRPTPKVQPTKQHVKLNARQKLPKKKLSALLKSSGRGLLKLALIRAKSELQDKIAAAECSAAMQCLLRACKGSNVSLICNINTPKLVKETNEQAKKAIIFEQQTALVANQRETQRDLNELQAKADQDQV
jgi:hypothetical protein